MNIAVNTCEMKEFNLQKRMLILNSSQFNSCICIFTVKPQQSPYKKTTPISSVPIKPRTMTVISTPPPPKAPDIILKAGKEPEGELQVSAWNLFIGGWGTF